MTGPCDPGYFCSGGTTAARPVTKGGKCLNGTYCPEESSQPLLCPARKYCGSEALPAPSDDCAAGYYCIGGSTTPRPKDGITGNECPAGAYCIAGSSIYVRCPEGTYSNATRNERVEDCANCTSGYYCEGVGNTEPTDKCDAGYYCPEGSILPNQTITPAGHFTPVGSSEPQPCLPGTYQPHQKQSRCLPCEPGFFCDTKNMTSGKECGRGFYCPPGTDRQFACPEGTFNNYTRQVYNSSCLGCPRGQYCNPTARSVPTGTRFYFLVSL